MSYIDETYDLAVGPYNPHKYRESAENLFAVLSGWKIFNSHIRASRNKAITPMKDQSNATR